MAHQLVLFLLFLGNVLHDADDDAACRIVKERLLQVKVIFREESEFFRLLVAAGNELYEIEFIDQAAYRLT